MSRILIIIAFITNISIKAKIFRLDKIRFYKDINKGEYLRWFRDIEIRFLINFKYFII